MKQKNVSTDITIGLPLSTDPTQPFLEGRAFLGSDGNTYYRRRNIKMGEWRAYTETEITLLVQQHYFVALFLGLVHADTLLLPWPQRLTYSVDVFDNLTFEQYFAIRDEIFNDIVNPAAPKVEASPTSDADGA